MNNNVCILRCFRQEVRRVVRAPDDGDGWIGFAEVGGNITEKNRVGPIRMSCIEGVEDRSANVTCRTSTVVY